VFSSPQILKKFGFWFIILQNETKYYAKFLAKRWLFSILDFGIKRPKNLKESHEAHEDNKFCILDGTKHDPKNFGILHFIIPKQLSFAFFWN